MPLLIGTVGALVLLACFVANETTSFSKHSLGYSFGNIFGSALLMAYAYQLASWPFLILNLVWMIVALRDAIRTLAGKQKSS